MLVALVPCNLTLLATLLMFSLVVQCTLKALAIQSLYLLPALTQPLIRGLLVLPIIRVRSAFFVGASYTNSQSQTIFGQYYPSGSLNGVAYVIDDPEVVFQVQSAGSVTIAALGANTFFSTGAVLTGSTTTGNSTASIVAGSSAIQTTAGFRIIGFPDMKGFSAVGDAFTDVFVKVNPGWHSYNTVKGV